MVFTEKIRLQEDTVQCKVDTVLLSLSPKEKGHVKTSNADTTAFETNTVM